MSSDPSLLASSSSESSEFDWAGRRVAVDFLVAAVGLLGVMTACLFAAGVAVFGGAFVVVRFLGVAAVRAFAGLALAFGAGMGAEGSSDCSSGLL